MRIWVLIPAGLALLLQLVIEDLEHLVEPTGFDNGPCQVGNDIEKFRLLRSKGAWLCPQNSDKAMASFDLDPGGEKCLGVKLKNELRLRGHAIVTWQRCNLRRHHDL